MRPRLALAPAALATLLAALGGCAQLGAALDDSDPFRLTEPKDFVAKRSSSNNADWSSNDDSKRPIPGETTVLADLQGPGVVTNLWMMIADNEYGWPRLLRLRVYYDGSPTPSVDAPLGDFFAVAAASSARCSRRSSGTARPAAPGTATGRCPSVSPVASPSPSRRRVSMLYYHVDWRKVPSLAPDVRYFHAWYRQELPAPPQIVIPR